MNKQRKTFRKLDDAIARLKRGVESVGVEPVRDVRVRQAYRELQQARKGGQIQQERIVRAVVLLSEAVCEAVLSDCGE